MVNDEEVEYCEWCGEFPYYITIYEDVDGEEETLICRKCYDEIVED